MHFLQKWYNSTDLTIMNETNDLSGSNTMEALTANEAKTQFGDMLLKAQRSPVQINKNGKPVAVVISVEEYESMEELKLDVLKARAEKAKTDIASGNTVDGASFLNDLVSGKYD